MTDIHIMLDLETFGTNPSAAIVQIGAVVFYLDDEPQPLPASFERTVALQSSILAGGKVDVETVGWWRSQSFDAKAAVCSDAVPLAPALVAFALWLPLNAYLWSHGAAFDVPVLDSAYRSINTAPPWNYRRVRDTRTLFWLAETTAGWQKPKRMTAHTARADAAAQAADVVSAYTALCGDKG